MESSIAEFLLRQLAPEQLPTNTSRACPHCALRVVWAPEPHQPRTAHTHALQSAKDRTACSHLHEMAKKCCHWSSGVHLRQTYLLGLLAMIKCSICSYQCDN